MRTNLLFSLFLIFSSFNLALTQHNHANDHDHDHSHHDHEPTSSHYKKPIKLDVKSINAQLASKKSSIMLPYLSSDEPFEIEEFKFYDGDINPVPGLRTFRLNSEKGTDLYGRMVVGPHGVNLNYMEHGKNYRIYYEHENGEPHYYEEYGKDLTKLANVGCTQGLIEEGEKVLEEPINLLEDTQGLEKRMKRRFGDDRRIFRAAVVLTGSYYQNNGGSITAAKQRAVENIVDISMIFEREINVFMIQAKGSPEAPWSSPDADRWGFTNDTDPEGANSYIRGEFDDDDYDIGHILHNMPSGGSGRAGVGVVCRDGQKARAWSGFAGNTSTSWISLAAHEFGHQMGSPHTYAGDGANCAGDQFPDNNAYEMASGVTLMSYNGICGDEWNIGNNTVNDDSDVVYDYLHAASLNFITNHLNSDEASECNIDGWDIAANNMPIADANPCGAEYNLPSNTPFFIRGDATDADGDNLTYSWEQFDRATRQEQGNIGNDAATSAAGPLFRCYPPNGNPERHIPRRSNQLDKGYTNPYEVLPRQKRSITMRLVVRDNNPGGGAIDWDDIRINVTRNDFRMTAPLGSDPVVAGGTVRVEWQGAEGLCDKAEVRLSTDGGNSFPIVLESDIPFSKGFEVVTLPMNLPVGSEARFQIRCADYECFGFYQISNENSEIQAANCNTAESGICDTEYLSVDYRSPLLDFGKLGAIGSPSHYYTGEVVNSSPEMKTTVFNSNRTDCRTLNVDANPFHAIQVTPAKTGSYYFEFADVNTNQSRLVEVYSIFEKDGFNPASPCASFVGSNSISNGGYVDDYYMRVNLEACKEYFLIAQPTKNNALDIQIKMEGSGDILSAEQEQLNTNLTYVAFDINKGEITFETSSADFQLLSPGTYEIYSVSYDGADPSSWIGLTLDDLTFSNDCIHVSSNFKPLEISSACAIVDPQFTISSPCSSVNNTYSLDISFSVDLGPSSGMVIINEQSFPMSGGTNNVTLTGLIADGLPLDLDFSFSADAGCQKTLYDVLVAPENCCNITLDLGNQDKCTGEDAVLNAGTDGDSYQWFLDEEMLNETSNELIANEPGIYSVIVTAGQCQKPDVTSVSFSSPPIVDIITPDSTACEGERIRIISIPDNYDSISWRINDVPDESFLNLRNINATEAGQYEMQVFNGGCMRSDFITIELLESTTFSLGPDIDECSGSPVPLDTGDPNLTYVWEQLFATPAIQPSITSTFTATEEGFYIAYGTNDVGCTSSDTIRINYEELDPEGLDLGPDLEDCEGDLFRFRVDFSPVNWYKDGELIIGLNANSIDVFESGTYVVEQYITEDCVARDTAVVIVNPLPELELGPNMSFCQGEVIDTCLYAGEDFKFSYDWSRDGIDTGNNRGKQAVTEPGLYNVAVRDADTRCFVRDVVIVEYTDSPTIEIASAPVSICEGGPGRIIAESPTVGISWYLDGVLTDFSESSIDITKPGTYRAVVGDGQSCQAEAEVVVLADSAPELDLPEILTACEGDPVELDAGPETLTYEWYNSSFPTAILGRLNTFTITQQGEYVVMASNGICSSSDTIAVIVTESPFLTLPADQVFCLGDTEQITASTNADFIKWYRGTEVLSFSGRTIEITEPGTYTAVSQEGQDCEVRDEIVIEFNDIPTGSIADVEVCEGQPAVFIAGADSDYAYSWQVNGLPYSNNGGTLSLQSTDISGLSGEVSVVITNLNNDCSITSTAMVVFQAGSPIQLDSEGPYCEGGSAIIEAAGNTNSLSWFRNGILQTETGDTFEATRDGTYLVVAGTGDCAQRDSVNIVFGDLPDIFIKDQTLCTGETATFTAGPDGAYTYQWYFDNNLQASTLGSISLSTAGDVRVVATSDAGCVTELEAELEYTDGATFRIVNADDDECYGSEATIRTVATVNAVRWFFMGQELEQTGSQIKVTEPGNYIGIAGEGDCEVMDDIDVTFLESPDISITDQTLCSSETATFMAGPDGAYIYTWEVDGVEQANTTGTLVLSASDITEETAEIQVTAKFLNDECEITLTAILEFIDSPEVRINPVGDFCDGNPVTISTVTNVSALTWTRNGMPMAETGTSIEVTEGGTYIATAGSGACASEDEIILVAADSPEVTILSQSVCQSEEATFVAGADGAFVYSWYINDQLIANTSGTLTLTQADITGTTAEVRVIAKNNNDDCSGESATTVEFIESPTLEINEPDVFCLGDIGTLTTNTDNVSTLRWFLDGAVLMQDGLTIEVEEPGEYLAIAGSGPCAVRDSVIVEFKNAPEAPELMSQSPCQGEEAIFMAGPDAGFEYSWFIDNQPVATMGGTLVVTEADIISSPAVIKVVVKNIDDECSVEAETTVEFISSPSLTILEPEGFCKGSPGTIRTDSDNVTTLSWFLDGTAIAPDGLEIEIEEDGLYLAIAGSGPCAVRDSIEITFADSPDIMIADQSKCAGEEAVFIAGPDDAYDYVWYLDNEELTNVSGTLTVMASDLTGNIGMVRVVATNKTDDCNAESTATIEFIETPMLDLLEAPDFCEGTPATLDADANVNSLRWFIDGVEQTETTLSIDAEIDGWYLAIAGDGACAVRDSVFVEFSDSPMVMISDQSKCAGEEAIFEAGADDAYDYEWYIDGVIQMNTLGSFVVTDADVAGGPGVITVVARNKNDNCSATQDAMAEFIATPELVITDPGSLCIGSTATLETSTNVSSLRWFLDSEEQVSTDTELEITEGGWYLAIAGEGACAVRDSIEVIFDTAPEIELSSIVKCAGEDAVFVAGPDGDYEYEWTLDGQMVTNTTGSLIVTSSDIAGDQATVEVVARIANSSCSTSLSAMVEFIQAPELSITPPGDFCDGDMAVIETMTNVGTLKWFLDGQELPDETTDLPVSEGGLYLAIAGDGQCAVRDSVEFSFAASPVISLSGDTDACEGESTVLTLDSDTNGDVVWSRNGMEIPNESGMTLNVIEEGIYTAAISNSSDCSSEDMIEVTYYPLADADIPQLPSGICEGVSFEVFAESNGDFFEWLDPNGDVVGSEISQEFDSSGDYVFIAYNLIGCPTEFPFTLEFRPAPEIDLGDDQRICEGTIVDLSVPSEQGIEYEWEKDGVPLPDDGNGIVVSEDGDYRLTATNDIGCESSDVVSLTFVPNPTLQTETDVAFCSGDPASLIVITDASLITWELGNQVIDQNVETIDINLGGTYTVTAETPEGCSTMETITVDEISVGSISFPGIELCPGDDPVVLDIEGDFDTYEWTGAITSTSSSVTIPYSTVGSITTEVVNVVAAKGECSTATSFEVTYFPPIVPVVEDDMPSICIGDSVVLGVSGGSNYSWTDPNGSLSATNIPNPTASPSETTTYEVMVGDICPNNFETVSITVVVNPLPVANAGNDKSTIPNEAINLDASGGVAYMWDNTDLINGSSTIADPEVLITELTTFTVTVTDENGCSGSDSVEINIVDDPREVLNVVDAFSPNGDGKNDMLEFDGLELFPENRLTIFNRWGNIIYEKRNYQLDELRWDGTRNGKPLPAAAYYYILEFADFKVKSSITLIRD